MRTKRVDSGPTAGELDDHDYDDDDDDDLRNYNVILVHEMWVRTAAAPGCINSYPGYCTHRTEPGTY